MDDGHTNEYVQSFLKQWCKKAQEPKYDYDIYHTKIHVAGKTIPVDLIIRRDRSQKIPFL